MIERGSSNSPVVYEMLLEIAERESIPYSVAASPSGTGTDADAGDYLQTGAGDEA